MSLVYLAGPITGLSYNGCTDWRKQAKEILAKNGITALSPMRGKDFLLRENSLKDHYDDHWLGTSRGITTRDRWDCTRCDAVLMNLLGATRVSIGTMIEAGWCDAARNPLVICMEKDNIHQHSILNECAGYVVDNLDEGILVIKTLLAS